ncbi:MAG: methyltransferase [Clostridiales bacterium]|nr:methyltransferase [Clostridiales bacterium]
MQIDLKPNEKIEDLQCDGLQLIQSSSEYRFTTDAVLLANFCRDMRGKTCVEFGAGSGVISLLVAKKKHPKAIVALEIQSQLCDMMNRSVLLNDLQNVISVYNCDLKDARSIVKDVDVVVCNPPYRRVGSGERQLSENIAICRHEIKATLCDVVQSASSVLNNRGNFYLVHQADRICEIITLCRDNNVAVKEILPVCPAPGKQPNLVLVRGVKAGEQDCKLHAPMYICDEQGNYTPQAKAWYEGIPLKKASLALD